MSKYTNYSYLNKQNTLNRNKEESSFKHTLLFYVLPFIIINLIIFYVVTAQPRFDVTTVDSMDYGSVNIELKLKSLFPVKSVSVELDDTSLELKKDGRTYTTLATTNGTLTVSLTNLNGMTKTEYLHINSIDDAPPIVNLDSDADNKIVLSFEDTQSGVDYDGIYGLDSAGKKIMPSLIDEGTSTVTFNYDGLYIEVHVPDKAGHEAIANFGAEASFDTTAAESGEE